MALGAGRHDDGEFDHSQNDELRMCGMAGDDEDDDVREDAAVLFGRSAADPLPVDDSDPPVDVADADGGQFNAWADTGTLSLESAWHDTARSKNDSAVPGPGVGHGGTTRHSTVHQPCLACHAQACHAGAG